MSKVVKERFFVLENTSLTIFARIVLTISETGSHRYQYLISHYYRPAGYSGSYKSGRDYAATLEECEELLDKYIEGFTTTGIIPNHYFYSSRKKAIA